MFVQTQVTLGADRPVVALPASAINYAPYGDSVFVVAELKNPQGQPYRGVRQQVVKLGAARGDQIAVLSRLESRRRSGDIGRLQAAQRRRRAGQQQGAAGEQRRRPKPEDS